MGDGGGGCASALLHATSSPRMGGYAATRPNVWRPLIDHRRGKHEGQPAGRPFVLRELGCAGSPGREVRPGVVASAGLEAVATIARLGQREVPATGGLLAVDAEGPARGEITAVAGVERRRRLMTGGARAKVARVVVRCGEGHGVRAQAVARTAAGAAATR